MTNRIDILKNKSKSVRGDVINIIYNSGTGHPGGSLSCVDILVALYFDVMKKDDKFILSKGHAVPSLYAILSELNYITREDLNSLRKNNGYLQGHPCYKINGIEVSSGSLGQGLSIASGLAMALELEKSMGKVYVLLGDGECDEGQIWEAAMFASHQKLDNLVAIVDRNKYQIDGTTEEIVSLEPFKEKWESFGWEVTEIDGHNFIEIINSLNKYVLRPHLIIANTIKGKGISITEGSNRFHGKSPSADEMITILEEFK
jgi:transketolase